MKLEKKALGISLYLFIASFFLERLWFNSDHLNLHNSIYIITKVMLLFTLIILGQVLYKGIIMVLQKDENAIFFAKIFFVYFILLIAVLLLIWPGIWRWDEFWMIDGSKWFYVAAAQNFLMSFFYICCLSILPFPAGIIIIQLLCVSGMVAYFVVNIYKWIIKDKKIASLTLIPFLLFPVIDSNLYPLRCTLYAFVELTLLSMILFKVIEFQKEQEKKVSNIFIFVYIIFSIILSVMRTEGKYYIILAPVLYIWFLGRYSNSRQKLAVVCVVLICSLTGNNYQNKIMQEQIGDRNTIVSTLNYLQYILKDDNLKNQETEMLDNVNKVVAIEVLEQYGPNSVWDSTKDLIRKDDYSRDDYSNFMKTYAKLVFKHPIEFMKVQVPIFFKANAISLDYQNQFIKETENLFDENSQYYTQDIVVLFRDDYFSKACFSNIRKKVIQILEFKASIFSNTPLEIFRILGYNSIPAILCLVGFFIWFIKQKRIKAAFLFIVPLIKLPLIVATAPDSFFMYYFSIYLIGQCVLFVILIKKVIYDKASRLKK